MTVAEAIKEARRVYGWMDMPSGEPSSVNVGFLKKNGREDETQLDLYSDDFHSELEDLWSSLYEEMEADGEDSILYLSLLAEIKPKADYLDHILHSKALVLITQIAKDYGMSAVRFNQLLADLGIQYRVREQWVLYAKYQDQGYTASKCFEIPKADGSLLIKYQTEWTQKGRRFLYLFLKKNGYIPVMEQQLYDMTKAR